MMETTVRACTISTTWSATNNRKVKVATGRDPYTHPAQQQRADESADAYAERLLRNAKHRRWSHAKKQGFVKICITDAKKRAKKATYMAARRAAEKKARLERDADP